MLKGKAKKSAGLRLSIAFQKSGAGSPYDHLGCALLSLILYTGILGTSISILGLESLLSVMLYGGALIIFCAFFFCHTPRTSFLGITVIVACLVILWIAASEFARAGFSLIANQLQLIWDIKFLAINSRYEVEVAHTIYPACVTLFLLPFAALIALLCVLAVSRANGFLGAFAMLGAAIFAVTFTDSTSFGFYGALMVLGAILLVVRAVSSPRGVKKAANGKAMLYAMAVLLAAGIFGSAVLALMPNSPSQKLESSLERTRRDITELTDNIRYERGAITPLSNGDFSKIKPVDLSYENMLNLISNNPQSIYLRGYIGEVYTNMGWQSLNKQTLHSYESLFYQLYRSDFYPQTQLADVALLLDSELSEEAPITLEIKNEAAARKYIYTPYELLSAPDDLLSDDRITSTGLTTDKFFGEESYTLTMLPNQIGRNEELSRILEEQSAYPSEKLAEYLSSEAKYRSFVYEQYTAILPEDSALLSNYIGEAAIAGQTHVAYRDAKNNILAMLQRQLTYTENGRAFDGDGSFIRFVVRSMQEGSAEHYATVAAMMFRHYGIPARYVEGFIITPDDADEWADNDGEFALTDFSAHAWVEYYHDGLGWIPFESDPNYLNVMEGLAPPPMGNSSSGGAAEEEEPEEPPERDHNRDKDKQDEESGLMRVLKLLLPFIILLALLASAVALWLYYRKRVLKKRLAGCTHFDTNKAIMNITEYLLLLLKNVGISSPANSLAGLVAPVEEKWGTTTAQLFCEMAIISQMAAFSNHLCDEAQRSTAMDFLTATISQIDLESSKKQRFIFKYIKLLY